MLAGERDKLLKMEQAVGRASSARNEGGGRRRQCRAPARAGLQDPNRPIGFVPDAGADRRRQDRALKGPGFLFDDDQAMVRIDMSEFMEKHAVSA